MKLHQLLRLVTHNLPIVLFDISNIKICEVCDKDAIDVDLFDYDVLKLTVGYCNDFCLDAALYITLEK